MTPTALRAVAAADGARVSTGVPGLDAVLEGGFPRHRAVLVRGPAGSGKTLLALQFLAAGLAREEYGLYISVDQKPRHLLSDAARFDWPLASALERGLLTVLDASPYFTARSNKTKSLLPIDARTMATSLSQQVRRTGARRLAIDALPSLVPLDLSRAEAHDYLRSLMLSLEDALECTTIVTARPAADADPHALGDLLDALASGVLQLGVERAGDRLERRLYIQKMRATAIEPAEFVARIDQRQGLHLLHASGVRGPAAIQ